MQEDNGSEKVELAIVKGASSGILSFSKSGLKIAEDTTYEQWLEGLKAFKLWRNYLEVGFADYIEWGKKKFGNEKIETALGQLEFDALFVNTALKITELPEQLRLPELTADHYLELLKADIPDAKRIEWARIAHDEGMTAAQLRFSMAENQNVGKAAAKALQTGIITVHGIRQQFDVWLRRVGGLAGILKMDEEHRDEIFSEISAIIEFGEELKKHLAVEA